MKITLKAARVNRGLTQLEVANQLHINKGTLINYEKYRTIPDIETAKLMATLYGVSVNDLIFLPEDCALSTNQ
jgi:transcriptional regulator with XRE-family HTH domain